MYNVVQLNNHYQLLVLLPVSYNDYLHCMVKGFQVWVVPSNGWLLVAVHCTPRKVGVPTGQGYCDKNASAKVIVVIILSIYIILL